MQHLLHAIHAIAWKTQNGLFWFETVCYTVKNRYYTAVSVHPCYIHGLLHALHVITPPSHPKGWFKPWNVKIPTMFPPFSFPWGPRLCSKAKCHGETKYWSNKMVNKNQSCKRFRHSQLSVAAGEIALAHHTAIHENLQNATMEIMLAPCVAKWKCYHGDRVSSMRSHISLNFLHPFFRDHSSIACSGRLCCHSRPSSHQQLHRSPCCQSSVRSS